MVCVCVCILYCICILYLYLAGSDTGYYQQQRLCLAALSLASTHLLSSLRRLPRVNISNILIVILSVFVILSVIVTCTFLKLFLC